MGKQVSYQIQESIEELESLKRKYRNTKLSIRVQALILMKNKSFKRQREVATAIGKHIRTIERWMVKYRSGGIDAYLSHQSGGAKHTKVDQETHELLERKLQDAQAPLKGYWEACIYVEQQLGKHYAYNTLRTYMIRHFKSKLKSPRKSHYKKDEQAIEAFFKTA